MRAATRLVLAVLPSAVLALPASAQGPDRAAAFAPAFPEVDRAFTDYAREAHVPGMAWGVIVDGRLVHAGTFGVQDTATQAPVTADTVFRIASMTKSFTAVAILSLRDAGKLSLDDPAERYVPELKGLAYPTSDSPRITIRHLLTHAAGFPEDNPWGDQQLALSDDEMAALMRQGIPFSNPPGLAYEYSNYGFAILGRIVARVSGMPYRDYVRARVLEPLGLSATTLDASAVPAARLAHGYRWEDRALEGRAAAARRRVRRDGRHADVAARPLALRRLDDGRLARARRRRAGPAAARVAARNAAGVAHRPGAGEPHRGWRPAAQCRRLRLRTARVADLRLRPRGGALRRAARLRVADALAAGVRRRVWWPWARSPTPAGDRASTPPSTRSRRRAPCDRARRSPRRP